ncbi:MAG: hypothetical protein M0Z94_08210 [Dehalococcoidales bacterium]|nr:hypothetical protein [Dehalococcoidales bacterium]
MRNLLHRLGMLELALVAVTIAGLALLASCTFVGPTTASTPTAAATTAGRGPGVGPPSGVTPDQGPGLMATATARAISQGTKT